MRPNTKNDEKTQGYEAQSKQSQKNSKSKQSTNLNASLGATRSMLNLRKPEHPPGRFFPTRNSAGNEERILQKTQGMWQKKPPGIWQKTQGI